MQGYYENHRDELSIASAWYTHNDRFVPHFHSSVELVYVLEGTLHATLDGVEHRVDAGSLLIDSPYTVHGYDTPEYSYAIVATIPFAVVPSLRVALSKQAFAAPVCADDDAGALRALMAAMVAHDTNHVMMKGLCYTILGLLIERVGLVEVRTASQSTFIRDVLEYLQLHHAEPLSVERIAQHFGYSRSRFSHIFNAQLGCTMSDYLGSLRCRHAAQLLRETDMPVSDVALAVGFESLRTFYRTFKKQYEMTPNRYARA